MAFTYERTWAFSIDNPYTPSTALDDRAANPRTILYINYNRRHRQS